MYEFTHNFTGIHAILFISHCFVLYITTTISLNYTFFFFKKRPEQQKQFSLLVKIFDMLSKKSCTKQILNSVEVPGFVVSALSHLRFRQVRYILGPKFQDKILIRGRFLARLLSLSYHLQDFGLVCRVATGEAPWLQLHNELLSGQVSLC